jgi:hypothetical protein
LAEGVETIEDYATSISLQVYNEFRFAVTSHFCDHGLNDSLHLCGSVGTKIV